MRLVGGEQDSLPGPDQPAGSASPPDITEQATLASTSRGSRLDRAGRTAAQDLGTHSVRRVRADETTPVAHLLARAFANDPIELWCLACDDLPGLIELEFLHVVREVSAEGWLWVIDDLSGVAAWLPPGVGYTSAIDDAVAPVLAAHGGQPDRSPRFWNWVDDHRPTSPHWYVDLLAVEPDRRSRGRGHLLLEDGLARLDELAEPSFLVTGNPLVVPWYQRHEFAVSGEEDAPGGGPRVWFMTRPPSL